MNDDPANVSEKSKKWPRRPRLILFLGLIPVLVTLLLSVLQVALWSGRKSLPVKIWVVDSSALMPIPHVSIEVLKGPLEWPTNHETDFEIVIPNQEIKELKTGESGFVEFTYSFKACGRDSLFYSKVYVQTRGVWVRVTAEGYAETYLPLDGQSVGGWRQVHNDSPVLVTVPMGKR